MQRLLFAMPLIALLILPGAAFAQGTRFEITPQAGYRLNGPIDAVDRHGNVESTDLQVEESAFYGLTVDIPIGYRWQLELLANQQQTNLTLDEGLFEPDTDLGDLDLSYYQVGLAYVWGRGQVNPFFGASLGLARIEPDAPLDAENRFAASLGGGVKVFFSENIGLRFEARGYYVHFDTSFEDRHRDRRVDEALYQGEGSVGLIFAF
jgi:opacity protein-like surface antigen